MSEDLTTTQQPTTVRELLRTSFESHPIDVVELHGAPGFLAPQVGAALDYAEGGARLARTITQRWTTQGEMEEGKDYTRLQGDGLRALKALRPDLVHSQARHMLVLAESGLFKVLMLTGQEVGRKLREHLATEVLPKLAAGAPVIEQQSEVVAPAEVVAVPALTPQERRLQAKEARLQRQADAAAQRHRDALMLKREQLAVQRVGAHAEADRAHADKLRAQMELAQMVQGLLTTAAKAGHLAPAIAEAQVPRLLQLATGEEWELGIKVPGYIQKRDGWLTATEIGRRIGLASGKNGGKQWHWVGIALKETGLRSRTDLYQMRPVLGLPAKADGTQRMVDTPHWNPCVVPQVKAYLKSLGREDLWRGGAA